jgi:menaquinone-9 beta-reductase
MPDQFDVIVVGGGIGGGAMSTALARAGLAVLVLEKSDVYRDHVRGEWMAPWGVAELNQLGLYESVLSAGGHHVSRHLGCDEDVPPAEAVAKAMDLTGLVPDAPGPLCIGHPALCQHLVDSAVRSGATLRREVTDVRISLGAAPEVLYRHHGIEKRATCRLIVGADGRSSVVRRQAGIELHRDPTHHLFAGMLVEDAAGWPADAQTIGTAGDVHFLAFPQGGGRLRLYLGYEREQARRLAGPTAQGAFLDAFRLACVPDSEHLAGARPAGPCNSYPNEDTWTDTPYRDGVVLIGDAAGSNDPIIGQGLSITLRDVRLVRDTLLAERQWTSSIFAPFAVERSERMRRLRFSASIVSTMANEFGPAALERRRRARERQTHDPTLLLPLFAVLVGPHNVPADAFEEHVRERLFAS